MTVPTGYRFDTDTLARRVREKRSNRSLRAISDEIGISIAVLSRIENRKMPPDYHNFGVLCRWLGDMPGDYFIIDGANSTDPLTIQLRAAKNISQETASAFMEIISAAYAQILASTAVEDIA